MARIKLPIERDLAALHRQEHFRGVEFNLDLREKLGQLGFVAALSGFRAIVADALFIQAHVAWERTEWGRILLLFRHITTLQPRVLLFWDTAAWHMAWNASVAAMNDQTQPRLALRVKAQREYFALGKDFLERGIKNNPDRPQLYEALARLYKEKYKDHAARFRVLRQGSGLAGCSRRSTDVSQPTSFPTAKDASARHIGVCAAFMTRAAGTAADFDRAAEISRRQTQRSQQDQRIPDEDGPIGK